MYFLITVAKKLEGIQVLHFGKRQRSTVQRNVHPILINHN